MFQTFCQVQLKHLDGRIEEVKEHPLFLVVHGFHKQAASFSFSFNLNRFLISVYQQTIWLMLLPHLAIGNCYFTLLMLCYKLQFQFLIFYFILCCTNLSYFFPFFLFLFSLQLFWLYKCFSSKYLSSCIVFLKRMLFHLNLGELY